MRLLHRLDRDPTLTPREVTEEYQRLIDLLHDTDPVHSDSQNRFYMRTVPGKVHPSHMTSCTVIFKDITTTGI